MKNGEKMPGDSSDAGIADPVADEDDDEEEIDEEDEDDVVDEEDEDEDEDEDDEEEEEEEEERKSKEKRIRSSKDKGKAGRSKRSRTSAKSFMDIEATVGDDDDEEDYDDADLLGEAEEAHQAERELDMSRRRRINMAAAFRDQGEALGGAGHLASTIGNLEKRYQSQRYDGEGEYEQFGAEEEVPYPEYGMGGVDPARFIPDSSDAKLWIVKTQKSAVERDVIVSIMTKANYCKQKQIDFPIFSAFAPNGVKGHIYVEAEGRDQIKAALKGLRSVNLGAAINMVPMKEMCSVFLMGEKEIKPLTRGEWIRVTAGLYQNDLGQVLDHDTQTNFVQIRLIPRVDLSEAIERLKSGDKKRSAGTEKAKRPVARFFDREEIEMKGGDCEPGPTRGTFRFDGKLYEDIGYIIRKVRAAHLLTGDEVRATAEEVTNFSSGRLGDGEDGIFDVSRLPILSARRDAYKPGEMIIIQSGDLFGLKAKILSVEIKTVVVQPNDSRVSSSVSVPLSDIMKHFDIGASVKTTGGQHTGNAGLITSIDLKNKTASVFSPSLGRPFTCLLEDLQTCGDFVMGSGGISSSGGYNVGDLVQLSTQDVGVIVRIDPAKQFSVLKVEGKVEGVPLSRLATKRSSDFSTTLDSNRSQFGIKAMVTLLEDPYKGKTGRVCHIWKQRVFVKLTNQDENHGIVVVDGRQLRVSNADGGFNAFSNAPFQPTTSSAGGPPMQGDGQRGVGMRGGFSRGRGRRNIEGQKLRVTAGKDKGCIAEVMDVDHSNGTVRAKLCKSGCVQSFKKEQVVFLTTGRGGGFSDRGGGRGGGFGRGRGGSGGGRGDEWSSFFQNARDRDRGSSTWGAP